MADDKDPTFPRFYRDKVENGFKTSQAGHAVYDDVEMVEIIIPGQNQSIATERVKQHHRDRWPQQYAAWKAGQEVAQEGSPLELWPPLTPAQVANLKVFNVHTVEQLAMVDDQALSRLGMGARDLREKAKAWLENAKGGEALSQALAKIAALEAQQKVLESNNADLANRVRELATAQHDPA